MIKEKWWVQFCHRNRIGKTMHAYIQGGAKGAGPKDTKDTKLVFFYVVHPLKEMRGFGEFAGRIVGKAGKLWGSHGHETCLTSHEEYDNLTRGKEKIAFVRFEGLHEGSMPIPFLAISRTLGVERMPRRGRYVSREEAEELTELLR